MIHELFLRNARAILVKQIFVTGGWGASLRAQTSIGPATGATIGTASFAPAPGARWAIESDRLQLRGQLLSLSIRLVRAVSGALCKVPGQLQCWQTSRPELQVGDTQPPKFFGTYCHCKMGTAKTAWTVGLVGMCRPKHFYPSVILHHYFWGWHEHPTAKARNIYSKPIARHLRDGVRSAFR